MSNQIPTPDDLQRDDDAGIEQLLQNVGAREEPSLEMTEAIRSAVHAEWQSVVGARRRRTQWIQYSAAAGFIGIALTAAIVWRVSSVDPLSATIARADGAVQIVTSDGQVHASTNGQRIATGDTLRTGNAARVAIDFGNGLTARLDRNSELSLGSDHRVALVVGAIYVDALPGPATATNLIVDTAFGAVRHIGTQYQIRLVNDGLEVGVREGRIEVTNQLGRNEGTAGEQLKISAQGDVARRTLSPLDASWQWAAAIAPALDIDNLLLSDFLTWAARQSGKKLTYDSPLTQQAASKVKLRGSVEGLDVNTALTAVLSTTRFQRTQTNDESIHISMATSIESSPAQRPTP